MDKSGNGNHVSSVSGSPSFITNEFNAKSILRFSGAERMSVSDLLSMKGGDEAFTVFAVASTSQTSAKTILGIGDNFSNDKESWRLRSEEVLEWAQSICI